MNVFTLYNALQIKSCIHCVNALIIEMTVSSKRDNCTADIEPLDLETS